MFKESCTMQLSYSISLYQDLGCFFRLIGKRKEDGIHPLSPKGVGRSIRYFLICYIKLIPIKIDYLLRKKRQEERSVSSCQKGFYMILKINSEVLYQGNIDNPIKKRELF